jgi:CheY-like chemotaxis protein
MSEFGRGTTFNVYFPRVEGPRHQVVGPDPIAPLKGGSETLLVVEDEASLRNLARTVLEKLGYTVLLASNGCEGLRVVREHQGVPIALVISDVIMPLMSGKVMADELAVDRPLLKILFMSGYTDDALAQHGVLNPAIALLLKPYTPAELARKVRQLLDDPSISPHHIVKAAEQRTCGHAADSLLIAAV